MQKYKADKTPSTGKQMKNSVDRLHDQYVVFTGTLTITRKKAEALVKATGGKVQSSVTRKTTILVLGDQDRRQLREGYSISLKQEAAEKRKKEGQQIRIITEESFYELIKINHPVQLSLFDIDPVRKKRDTPDKDRPPTSSRSVRTARSEVQSSASVRSSPP